MAGVPTGRLLLALVCALCFARAASAQLPPFEVLHEFGDRVQPGPLIEASDGNFYGTTRSGGAYGRGTIFRMSRDHRVSILYNFSGLWDGGAPVGKFLQASDGHLYGATSENGAYNQGILYRFSLDGQFKTLHAFNVAIDGRNPTGSLVQGADGLLYGTTAGHPWAPPYDDGVAFRSTLDGNVTVLHTFVSGMNDGGLPGPLIQASDGNFYGKTALGGGELSLGTVFRMTPGGIVTIMHRFTEPMPSDSGNSTSRTLVQGADGNVYGQYGCGSGIFRLTLQGAFSGLTSLPGFCSYSGPSNVELTAGADGLLYAAVGFTFAVGLSGDSAALHDYSSSQFVVSVMQSINGHLYGSATSMDDRRRGQIVRITPRGGKVMKAGATSVVGAGVRVSWSPVVNAASYTVKRREPGGGDTVVASGLRAVAFADSTAIKGARYTYLVTATNAFGEGLASHDISLTAGRPTAGDFDGDGATDPAIFRPATGEWHIRSAPSVVAWGAAGDIPVAADYDGDGRVDIAVFRPSTGVWYVRGWGSVAFGGPGDIPVPGYYRGGTAADIAVFRPSTGTWHIRGRQPIAWGGSGDIPTPGDYDGDGSTDLAVFRASHALNDTDGLYILHATGTGEFRNSCCPARMAAGDYDGDGKTDLSRFYNSGEWNVDLSTTGGWFSAYWGTASDTPVPADHDGDGLADIGVFRESAGDWYILLTGPRTGVQFKWGGPGDIPIR